jgi:Domain of unknown function (DUF4847)
VRGGVEMRMKQLILMLLMLLPIVSGCNDTDDVQSIFTGRSWKLTYITPKNKQAWYKFTDVTDEIYKQYDPVTGSKSFVISFDGTASDGVISGNMSGTGSTTLGGTWSANGKTNAFSAKIVEGLKNATSYTGDNNNLFIYFEYKSSVQHDSEILCLAFAPAK